VSLSHPLFCQSVLRRSAIRSFCQQTINHALGQQVQALQHWDAIQILIRGLLFISSVIFNLLLACSTSFKALDIHTVILTRKITVSRVKRLWALL